MTMIFNADGHYDDAGRWIRDKLCFMDCGSRCTCRPPNGIYSIAPKIDSFNVDDKVRLKVDIWNDGADHHPPGYDGIAGDILIVVGKSKSELQVRHEDYDSDSFFFVTVSEVEKI